jgi:hypothetical protein
VTLGLGSVIASAVAAAPWLAVVSRHKELTFALAGALLACNYRLVVVRPRRCAPGEICHVDSPLMRWNRRVYWVSLGVYFIALAVTYGSLAAVRWM